MERQTDRVQEFTVSGDQVVATVKDLIHQGNVRRVSIKNEEGRTLLEIPLTVGVIGAALLPVFAALGALAALATRCTIVVERTGEPPRAPTAPPSAETEVTDVGDVGDVADTAAPPVSPDERTSA